MLVAYVYDLTDTVVNQLFKITNFQCRTVLNDIGTASFDLDPREIWVEYSYLKEFTRIRIAEQNGATENTVFDGVIRETKATKNGIAVTLNDFLYLLKKKKVYTNKTYSGVAISAILAELVNEMNARYASGITLTTSVSTTVSKEYKDFVSLYDVLQDIAEGGYEFEMNGKNLIFTTTLGADRTVDPNLVEFLYDVSVAQEQTITDYEIRRDSENFANAVTALPTSGSVVTTTDATSIAEYGRIEEAYSVDGDATAAANSNLANRKDSVSEVSVSPIVSDFFLANIGDKVVVYIDGGNDMQFYSGNLRVIEKNMQIQGSMKNIDYQLSTNKVSTPTLLDTIKTLRDRVRKLEL